MSIEKAIPKNWKWVKLGEACEVIMGQSPPSNTYNTEGKGLPFFQGKAEFTELYPVVEKWCSEPNKIAKPNDILLSVRAPVGTTNIANIRCCIGRGLAAIRFENYKYAYYFLKSKQQELDSKGTGTTFRAISGETIRETLFPLPPNDIQIAIVSKIEELFSELDKGIENLRLAQQQLKTYRQAVLKWAFEGRLTNENMKEGELPEGWDVVKIEDVTVSLDNKRKPINKEERKKRAGNIPYYGANGQVGWIDDYIFDEPLVCVVEDETFTGREIPFSYKITGKTWVNNHAHVLKPKEHLNIDFLNYQLFYYPFLKLTTGSTGRKKLTKAALSNAPIKICSSKEQFEIVNEIEQRLSTAEKIEEYISQSIFRSETLRKSILAQAFKGNLTK